MSSAASYFRELASVIERVDSAAVERLVDMIRRTRDSCGTIYTFGNGGSASTASHLALDLAKNVHRTDRPRLRIFSLVDNFSLLTAWANDSHYENVFAAQLEGVIRPGDLVLAISASGNSRNVLNAVRLARSVDACAFGITGFDGGRLAVEADDCVVVPSHNMQVVEDAHLAIVHAVMSGLRDCG